MKTDREIAKELCSRWRNTKIFLEDILLVAIREGRKAAADQLKRDMDHDYYCPIEKEYIIPKDELTDLIEELKDDRKSNV